MDYEMQSYGSQIELNCEVVTDISWLLIRSYLNAWHVEKK